MGERPYLHIRIELPRSELHRMVAFPFPTQRILDWLIDRGLRPMDAPVSEWDDPARNVTIYEQTLSVKEPPHAHP